MAHRGAFRSRGISQSQRRKKSWIQITGATNIDGTIFGAQNPNLQFVIASGTGASDTEGASFGFVSDPVLDNVPAESTILRIRGSINMPKNTTDNVNEVKNYAVGIGVMEATAALLGAFPNPATPDGGAWDGWMFYRSIQATALDANATQFDVKSMRKVQSGQSIIVVFGRFISTADGANVGGIPEDKAQLNMRALILLP